MQTHDPYWIDAATALGDSLQVIAHKDVRAESGLKLLAGGSRLNSSSREQLVRHKLAVPLEQCLRVEDGVHASQLRREANALRESSPLLDRLFATVATELAPIEIFNQIPLTEALSFKLTVAREQRPRLYRHGVLVASLALFFAVRAKWNRPQVLQAATAGLCHDLGDLHLDPMLFLHDRRLADTERRALHTHPTIAFLVLKESPEYQGAVSRGVLEHHERMDGSGYPQGLHEAEISPLGRLLAVAEVVASQFDEAGACEDGHRLATLLKLNSHKLDPQFVRLVFPILQHALSGALLAENAQLRDSVGEGLSVLGALLTGWEQATAAQAGCVNAEAEPMFEFVTEQMLGLRTRLFDAGFNPRTPRAVLGETDEGEPLHEMDGLVHESLWQLSWLAGEVARRWPDALSTPEANPVTKWLAHARTAMPGPLGAESQPEDNRVEDLPHGPQDAW